MDSILGCVAWNKALNWCIIKAKRSSDFPKFCMSSKWFHGRLSVVPIAMQFTVRKRGTIPIKMSCF